MNFPSNKIVKRQTGASKLPILIAVIVIIAAGIVYYISTDTPPPPSPMDASPVAPTPPPEPEETARAPDIPQPAENFEREEAPAAPELPPLTESDPYTREVLQPLSEDEEYSLWLQTENLLQKAVAIVDGLSRGNLLRKVVPIQPPAGSFEVRKEDDKIWLSEDNYQRFDEVVATLTSLDAEQLASSFQILRPLLEQAYGEMGYSGDKVDNSLIAAIDKILATPEPEPPLALKRESVTYQFADPQLEALPAIQKQLLRMGPENAAKLKAHLKAIRAALLAQPEAAD